MWGLGAVLHQAATGEPAFDDDQSWTADSGPSGTWDTDDQRDAGYPQLERPAPSVAAHRDDLPADLVDAIDACLSTDAADRPALEQLAAALTPHAPGARP